MKFDDAVMAIRTLLDLRRIAGAHVVDHRQLGEDELREAIIKLKTKYLDAETVRLNLERALYKPLHLIQQLATVRQVPALRSRN